MISLAQSSKVHELGKSKELFVNSAMQSGERRQREREGSLLKFADRPKIFHMLKEKKVGPPPLRPSGPLPFKFTGSFLLLLLLKVGRQ